MELSLDNVITKDNTLNNFKRELESIFTNENIMTYRVFDNRKFTYENEDLIRNQEKILIQSNVKDKLYEVSEIRSKEEIELKEYDGNIN